MLEKKKQKVDLCGFEPKFNKTIGHIFALKCNLKVPV